MCLLYRMEPSEQALAQPHRNLETAMPRDELLATSAAASWLDSEPEHEQETVPLVRLEPHYTSRLAFRTRDVRRRFRRVRRPLRVRVARPREHRPRAHRAQSISRRGPPRDDDPEPSDLTVVPLERFRADVDRWLGAA